MPTETFNIPMCRHLKTSGARCQSPALQGETFCFFHLRLHKEHPPAPTAREMVNRRNTLCPHYEETLLGVGEDPMMIARAYPNQNEFNFPPLEDADSIQLAASMLFHAVAQGQIHLRRARILRDILRDAIRTCARTTAAVAAANAAAATATNPAASADIPAAPANPVVTEIAHTANGVAIAADTGHRDARDAAVRRPHPTGECHA